MGPPFLLASVSATFPLLRAIGSVRICESQLDLLQLIAADLKASPSRTIQPDQSPSWNMATGFGLRDS
jgi:hypothetical protein